MTLNESVKELSYLHDCLNRDTDIRFLNAIKLGIEALKLVRELRLHHGVLPDYLLPGETKE